MQPQPARWLTRVGAQLIDALVLGFFTLVIAAIVFGSGVGSDSSGVTAGVYGFVLLTAFLYNALLIAREGERNGQTLGKQAVGIRVVRVDGKPVTLDVAARREGIGRALLSIIPLYALVDILWPLGDPANQALHDKVGRTLVVTADASAAGDLARPGDGRTFTFEPERPADPRAEPVPSPQPAPNVVPYPENAPTEVPVTGPLPDADPMPAPEPAPELDLGEFLPPKPAAKPDHSSDDEISGPFGPRYDD